MNDSKHWQEAYLSDQHFCWLTFVQVSESLQQLYRQNSWDWDPQKFLYPPHEVPSDPSKYRVPLDSQEARELSLKIYCDRTVQHLTIEKPVLSQILCKGSRMPTEAMRKDLANFWRENPGGVYDFATGSLRIAVELCLKTLGDEVAKQVFSLRLALIAVFLFVQLAAFGVAGYSACADVKIHQNSTDT